MTSRDQPRSGSAGLIFNELCEFLLGEEALSFLGEGDVALGHGLEVGGASRECGTELLRVVVETDFGVGAVGVDVGILAEGLALAAEETADVVRQDVLGVAAGGAVFFLHKQ